jgi:hypothetical protein
VLSENSAQAQGFLVAYFFRFAQVLFTKLSTRCAGSVWLPLKCRKRLSSVPDSPFVNSSVTPRPRRQDLAGVDQIGLIYASFFGLRAALIHKFGACQDSEKIYQKFFLTHESTS